MSKSWERTVYEATRLYLRQQQGAIGKALDEAARQLAPFIAEQVQLTIREHFIFPISNDLEKQALQAACEAALAVAQADLAATPIGRDAREHVERLCLKALGQEVPRG